MASTSTARPAASTSRWPATVRDRRRDRAARSASAAATTAARPGRFAVCPLRPVPGATADRASGRTSSRGPGTSWSRSTRSTTSVRGPGSAPPSPSPGTEERPGGSTESPRNVGGLTNLGGVVNGVGLRERAERLANGDVFWAYGDGRHARGSAAGRVAIYGALIHIDQLVQPPLTLRRRNGRLPQSVVHRVK